MEQDDVSRPTALSTQLLETEFPNELLAWIFLFVRGPPASGALREARLVCKRWREVIDAHLNIAKPKEPFTSAYLLGYLTPPGVIPFPVVAPGIEEDAFDEVMSHFWDAHDYVLYLSLRDLTRRHCDEGNIDATRANQVYHWLDLRPTRVAAGDWQGLTHDDIQDEVFHIHALDVPRARAMGIVFTEGDLAIKLDSWGENEANFAGWSEEEIKSASLQEKTYSALPWLVRRGLVTADGVMSRLDNLLFPKTFLALYFPLSENDRAGARTVLRLITEQGLGKTRLTALHIVGATRVGWQLMQEVVRLASPEARHAVWEEHASELLDAIRDKLVYDAVSYENVLNWLHAQGCFFRAPTPRDADRLLLHTTNGVYTNLGMTHVRRTMTKWLLQHLPPPTSPEVVARVSGMRG